MSITGIIYGPPKVGKTWLVDSMVAPRLIIDMDGSTEHIDSSFVIWDPSTDPPEPGDWDSCIVHARGMSAVENVLAHLESGKHPFKSLGIDTAASLQDRVIQRLVGTAALDQQDWGTVLRLMKDLTTRIMDLRWHPTAPLEQILMTCSERKSEDGSIRPNLQGRYVDWLPYRVDLIGYLIADRTKAGVERRLLIEPRASIVAGSRIPFTNAVDGVIVNPNFQSLERVSN